MAERQTLNKTETEASKKSESIYAAFKRLDTKYQILILASVLIAIGVAIGVSLVMFLPQPMRQYNQNQIHTYISKQNICVNEKSSGETRCNTYESQSDFITQKIDGNRVQQTLVMRSLSRIDHEGNQQDLGGSGLVGVGASGSGRLLVGELTSDSDYDINQIPLSQIIRDSETNQIINVKFPISINEEQRMAQLDVISQLNSGVSKEASGVYDDNSFDQTVTNPSIFSNEQVIDRSQSGDGFNIQSQTTLDEQGQISKSSVQSSRESGNVSTNIKSESKLQSTSQATQDEADLIAEIQSRQQFNEYDLVNKVKVTDVGDSNDGVDHNRFLGVVISPGDFNYTLVNITQVYDKVMLYNTFDVVVEGTLLTIKKNQVDFVFEASLVVTAMGTRIPYQFSHDVTFANQTKPVQLTVQSKQFDKPALKSGDYSVSLNVKVTPTYQFDVNAYNSNITMKFNQAVKVELSGKMEMVNGNDKYIKEVTDGKWLDLVVNKQVIIDQMRSYSYPKATYTKNNNLIIKEYREYNQQKIQYIFFQITICYRSFWSYCCMQFTIFIYQIGAIEKVKEETGTFKIVSIGQPIIMPTQVDSW